MPLATPTTPIMTRTKQLRCPACNHTMPDPKGGIILRIGTAGSTRVLKRCTVCDTLRFQILERVGERTKKAAKSPACDAPADDRELTLHELAAYVSEKSIDIETAEAIASSSAPEPRKREIAALLAEGALDVAQARRLLAL